MRALDKERKRERDILKIETDKEIGRERLKI